MSFLNLTHTDISQGTKEPLDLHVWFKKAKEIASLDTQNLSSVVVVLGFILTIASVTLTAITGGFPWFVLMLIVFSPLYALMAEDDQPALTSRIK